MREAGPVLVALVIAGSIAAIAIWAPGWWKLLALLPCLINAEWRG